MKNELSIQIADKRKIMEEEKRRERDFMYTQKKLIEEQEHK